MYAGTNPTLPRARSPLLRVLSGAAGPRRAALAPLVYLVLGTRPLLAIVARVPAELDVSRGLSQQQRRILGLAYAFNCELHGGEYQMHEDIAPAGDRYREGFKHWLIVENATPPDFFAWMLEHYVGGVPFKKLQQWRDGLRSTAFYAKTPDYRCKKASLRRAVTILCHKGFLTTHTWRHPAPRVEWRRNIAYGYVLSPSAISVAAQYRFDLGDAVETVCTMFAATLWGAYGTHTKKDHAGLHLRWYAEANGYPRVAGGPTVTDSVTVTPSPIGVEVTDSAKGYQSRNSDEGNGYPVARRDTVTINRDGSIEGECA